MDGRKATAGMTCELTTTHYGAYTYADSVTPDPISVGRHKEHVTLLSPAGTHVPYVVYARRTGVSVDSVVRGISSQGMPLPWAEQNRYGGVWWHAVSDSGEWYTVNTKDIRSLRS